MSVPANSTDAFCASSTIALTGHCGRLLDILLQVAPKSVVLNRYGLKLSCRRPVLAAQAVPAAKRDAYTRLVQSSSGPPTAATFFVTSVQVPPPFCVTCTLPSSVPTQRIPGVTGDSEIVTMVQY